MTIRGCAYAGSKGVVWGPIKDMIHISHGPVGCGQYSWAARRNYYIGTTGIDTFVTMQFTSDFQEKDIVFGGDKKLAKIMDEIQDAVPAEQGDHRAVGMPDRPDRRRYRGGVEGQIEGIRRQDHRAGALRRLSRRVAVARPPHRQRHDSRLGIRQAGRQAVAFESTPYDVAIIGDYNIGGDAWSSRILLEEMGLRVIAQWSGDGSIAELEATPKAKLNVLHCYRSMNYISRHMEEKYGIPWVRIQLLRPQQDRRIAAPDRRPFRRQDQGRRRARHRQISGTDGRR